MILAIALVLLGAWSVKDGWFPAPSVQEKHPLPTTLAAPHDGRLTEWNTGPDPGATFEEKALLARVRRADNGEDVKMYAPFKGSVLELYVKAPQDVAAGDPLAKVAPTDSFYLFNKSLAVFCFIGAVASWIVHLKVN